MSVPGDNTPSGWRTTLSIRYLAVAAVVAALHADPLRAQECGRAVPGVLFAGCAGETAARLVLVGEGGIGTVGGPPATTRVTVTGAYTSGEKREPEGLFIVGGAALDPYPQGWDGVAVIDGDGHLSLHYAERIDMGRERFDLRRKPSRRAFAQAAKARGWSAFQSHMLVIDGRIDTRPREDAPRFARRLLYTLADGTVGLYETPLLTLHEAALAIHAALAPRMALNLDMGSYDYCRVEEADGSARDCGALAPAQTGKLSNLLVLSRRGADTVADAQ